MIRKFGSSNRQTVSMSTEDYVMDIEAEVVVDPLNASLNGSASNGSTIYEQLEQIEEIIAVVVPILFGIIVVIGLVGNTLVVVVVAFNPQMRSTTNVLIINLAVADLLFIVFCVPFTAFDYALPSWPFGDPWCRVVQYLVIVCAYASIYTLVLMSLDRFLAVVHPIASMSVRTVRHAVMAIGMLWAIILASCVPALQAHGVVRYADRYTVCIFLSSEGYSYAAFQLCFFLSSYVVPLALIFVLYLLMLKRLWGGVRAPSAESLRSKRRVTRLVVVVVAIFAACWCPIQIVLVLKSLEAYPLGPTRIAIQITAHVLAYTNSCVNPILYAFLSDNFRKAFRKVVACGPSANASSRNVPPPKTNGTTKTNCSSNDIL